MEEAQSRDHSWDELTKLVVQANPQDLVSLVLHDALYVGEHSTELIIRKVHADKILEVRVNDQKVLLHVEFQSQRDTTMARRMWEYNVMSDCLNGCPVYSVVIYLQRDGTTSEPYYDRILPNGQCIHHFDYHKIELWKIPTERFRQTVGAGLLPLLPLTQQGAQRETVEMMIADLQARGQQELLPLGFAFATFVLSEDAQKWLKWRIESMRETLSESWFYRDIIQQGLEQGLEQGREQGREQGLIQGRIEELRSVITRFVGKRYPDLTSLARQQVMFVKALEQLETMLDRLYDAQTVDEVRHTLLTIEQHTSQTNS